MKKASPVWILLLLLVFCFCLSTHLQPQALAWSQTERSQGALGLLFGDGRKLFANQFFTMADVYFHSGYYPSIFDKSDHESEVAAASNGHTDSDEDEKKEDFLGRPRNWFDAFGRNFKPSDHTHLSHGDEREILPWLRLAADMDPQMVETYTVGAYWLRDHLHQTKEAETFLREGLRNNPNNVEILFEMGRAYEESDHATNDARNIWEVAGQKYQALPYEQRTNDTLIYDKISIRLADLEDHTGNFADAIKWLQQAQTVSHNPSVLQTQIDDIKKKMAAQSLNILTNSLY
jgi:tetratricopeptide (TPR) repeat protein